MLPAAHRLRRSSDFTDVVRRGRRAGRGCLVLHVRTGEGSGPALVGFVVSRAVGNAVVRNQVTRRLRHVLRDRLPSLPDGTRVVVRANPSAARASSAELAADVDAAVRRLLGSAQRRVP